MDDVTNEDVARTLFGSEQHRRATRSSCSSIGLLLLVALLGGVFLAKEEKE